MTDDDEDTQSRLSQLNDAIGDLLNEYSDCLGRMLDLPVVTNWCLVVATDDAADSSKGTIRRFQPPGQWRHQSVGLLIAAADDYRAITTENA